MIQQLQALPAHAWQQNAADPVLLCAADDHYAKPLTVTLHSAASRLGPGRQLKVILLDGGLREESWAGLKESLADLPVEVRMVRPDPSQVEDLVTSHHITHTAYFRLLAAELLPDWLDRVIYLDSDVLVRDDLGELWERPLDGNYCLAVPDIACPWVDARYGGGNRRRANPYLAAISPIPNWRELGLRGDAGYFNSGVMVLNLRRWREESIASRLLDCLRRNRRHVWCWDQYALNVVFSGQWGALPGRWNQGAHLFEYPGPAFSPIAVDEYLEMRDRPAITHFTTEWKPWHARPAHPHAADFFEELDRTAWRGWRPDPQPFRVSEAWNQVAVKTIRTATIRYRQMTGWWTVPRH